MPRLACIDIGTVTARLAVADMAGGRVLRLAKHSEIVNLGEDVDRTGSLKQEAMERTFACVRGYVDSAREAGATCVCCTLTSAARDASNAREMGRALDSLGLDPLIIPGKVEGALTFLGVAQDFCDKTILVADNGGGSTELALGSLSSSGVLDLRFVRSIDVGARRVTEKFLEDDPPGEGARETAHRFVGDAFAPVVAEGGLYAVGDPRVCGDAPEALVVCGGTVTSLVAIDAGLEPYDSSRVHLAALTLDQVEALERRLATLTVAERAEVAGLQPKRAPVIVGGAVCVAELMRQTGFARLQASESDLLFGLAIAADAAVEGHSSPVSWCPTMRPLR